MDEKRALLIAVQNYQHLQDLHGPLNDLDKMSQALARHGFHQIRPLRDPDREEVLAALETLVAETNPGDQVLLYYSGHGSRLIWPGGTQESIVPKDSDRGGPAGSNRDVFDLEIDLRLRRLCRRTPWVTVIFDSCFSGDATRAEDDAGRGVTSETGAEVERLSEHLRRLEAEQNQSPGLAARHRALVLGSCAPHQLAREIKPAASEMRRPAFRAEGGRAPFWGRFTFFLQQALAADPPPRTWRDALELAERFHLARDLAAHRESLPEEWHSILPTIVLGTRRQAAGQSPRFERNLDLEIFGRQELPPHPHLYAQPQGDGEILLSGGRAHGVEVDSRWALHPPGTRHPAASPSLATLEIVEVAAFASRGRRMEGHSGEIPAGSHAFPMQPPAPQSTPPLRIALDLDDGHSDGQRHPFATLLHGPAFETEPSSSAADIVLHRRRSDPEEASGAETGEVWVASAGARNGPLAVRSRGIWPTEKGATSDASIATSPGIAGLVADLEGLCRFRRLFSLRPQAEEQLPSGLSLELPERVEEGEAVKVTLRNQATEPLFASLLLFGSDGEIRLLWPDPMEARLQEPGARPLSPRLEPGEATELELTLPRAPFCPALDLKPPEKGEGKAWLRLVAGRQPADLEFLTQEALLDDTSLETENRPRALPNWGRRVSELADLGPSPPRLDDQTWWAKTVELRILPATATSVDPTRGTLGPLAIPASLPVLPSTDVGREQGLAKEPRTGFEAGVAAEPQAGYLDLPLQIDVPPDGGLSLRLDPERGGSAVATLDPEEIESLATLAEIARPPFGDPELAEALGGKLMRLLFPAGSPARETYRDRLRQARTRGLEGVRIRLQLATQALVNLPWELLRQDGVDLALSRETPILRAVRPLRPAPRVPVDPPLRILVVVATPRGLSPLQAEAEWRALETAMEDLVARGFVTLERIRGRGPNAAQTGPGWPEIQRALRTRRPHIFHFVGHGGIDQEGRGKLYLAGPEGKAEAIDAAQLGTLLGDHPTLALAVLNACRGARQGGGEPFASPAATLARRGVQAVVSMQNDIGDRAALLFASHFYESLARQGLGVEAATVEARKAMRLGTRDGQWSTPALYLQAESGHLFDFAWRRQLFRPLRLPVPRPPVAPPEADDLRRLGAKVEASWLAVTTPHVEGARMEVLLKDTDDGMQEGGFPSLHRPMAQAYLPELFAEVGGSLLILGDAGSGKVQRLGELLGELLARARREEGQPVPVLFQLSDWAGAGRDLSPWLIDELGYQHQVPRRLAQRWIEERLILPLLDGLDGVGKRWRPSCLAAIRAFSREGRWPLVLTCGRREYLELPERLEVELAVDLQPLEGDVGAESSLGSLVGDSPGLRRATLSPFLRQLLEDMANDANARARLHAGRSEGAEEAKRLLVATYVQHRFDLASGTGGEP